MPYLLDGTVPYPEGQLSTEGEAAARLRRLARLETPGSPGTFDPEISRRLAAVAREEGLGRMLSGPGFLPVHPLSLFCPSCGPFAPFAAGAWEFVPRLAAQGIPIFIDHQACFENGLVSAPARSGSGRSSAAFPSGTTTRTPSSSC